MEGFIIASCTDKGRVRSVNEDSMTTFESPNGTVVVVSDGMGGQNAGDVASQLAVAVIRDILSDNPFSSPGEAIVRSVMAANQAILHRASMDPGLAGMGATCVMLIIRDGKVYYGSVGDSRIYYVASGMIRQLTKDQSYVQTLVDAGELTAEAAEHHKDKNQITNALGLEEMTPPVVGQMPITPEPGSVFVLCSDGLSGMINNKAILTTVSRGDVPLQERAEMLVKQANDAGGNDNITVQLVEFPAQEVLPQAAAPLKTLSDSSAPVMSKSKSFRRKTMPWTLLALLIFVIVGGVVWWCVSSPAPKPVPATTIRKAPETSPTPQKAKDQSKQGPTTIVVVEEQAKPAASQKEKPKPGAKKKEVKEDRKNLIKESSSTAAEESTAPEVIVDRRNENRTENKDTLKGRFD